VSAQRWEIENKPLHREDITMHRHIIAAAILGLAASPALAEGPINLRGMGSFHIGGRTVEITGKPVREVLLGAGGVPAKLDPNGLYAVEHMYVQFFLPQTRKGKLPLLMWHGGGLTGVTYETTPDGREGWLNCSSARAGTSTIRTQWSAAARASPAPTCGRAAPTF
jgi:hypothetical protein